MSGELYTCSPLLAYRSQRDAIDEAIRGVLDSSAHILGPRVAAFEAAFAAYAGATEGVGVANGTDAIEIALAAHGVGPGDEVVTVGLTAIATLVAIRRCGAVPVLVDIDPVHYTLDPERLEAALGPKVKAVIPVHLYGQSADMDSICRIARERGIIVLEDCAQATGTEYRGRMAGSLADSAAFSFYPTKNLGAAGDGGAVLLMDRSVAARARLLRQYGWQDSQCSEVFGWTSRLDELQAAILLVKLDALRDKLARRRAIARLYDRAFAHLPIATPAVRENCAHAYHLYVIQADERDALRRALAADKVMAGIHYPYLAHQQPAWRDVAIRGGLAVSERVVSRILSLPLYPEMTEEDVARVIAAVHAFYERRG